MKSFEIWTGLYEETQDSLALARIVLRKAKELALQERYLEALAELDVIRWEALTTFDEASDLMIEIKQEAGYPLSISEQRQIIRTEDIERLNRESDNPKEKIRRLECSFHNV